MTPPPNRRPKPRPKSRPSFGPASGRSRPAGGAGKPRRPRDSAPSGPKEHPQYGTRIPPEELEAMREVQREHGRKDRRGYDDARRPRGGPGGPGGGGAGGFRGPSTGGRFRREDDARPRPSFRSDRGPRAGGGSRPDRGFGPRS